MTTQPTPSSAEALALLERLIASIDTFEGAAAWDKAVEFDLRNALEAEPKAPAAEPDDSLTIVYMAGVHDERKRAQAQAAEPVGWLYKGTAPHVKDKLSFEPKRVTNLETRWWVELGPVYLSTPSPEARETAEATTRAAAVPLEWSKAVQEAYGWLWHVNNEPLAPVPLWSPDKAAYEARKCLRELLTTGQRGEAINAVRGLLENKAAATPSPAPAASQAGVVPFAWVQRLKGWAPRLFLISETGDPAKREWADDVTWQYLYTHPAPAEAVGALGGEVRGLTQAATDVLAERQRQVSAKGWTPEHDDEHHYGQLAAAAGCYALFARSHRKSGLCPGEWPWNAESWKPGSYRRALEKAGALILAEIERLDRAAARAQGEEGGDKP